MYIKKKPGHFVYEINEFILRYTPEQKKINECTFELQANWK